VFSEVRNLGEHPACSAARINKICTKSEVLRGGIEMRMLALSPLERLAGLAPLIVRVIVGVIMAAHGWQKLMGGRLTSERSSRSWASPCRRSWATW
jgi:hypothetical protein